MNIDHFKPATAYTIYIASTPEQVWEALTSAEFSRKYFFGNSVEVDLRVGGAYVMRTPDGSLHISGEVIECDPPRKLTVTFNVNWPALIERLGATLVTYEIERAGDAVRLTMTEAHDRPLSDDILSGGRQGWPAILSSLKSLLAGDRRAAGRQDGAAATDAGGAEEDGHHDAVASPSLVVAANACIRRDDERTVVRFLTAHAGSGWAEEPVEGIPVRSPRRNPLPHSLAAGRFR